MRIYVAGKFEEKEAVRHAQACLVADGHRITHDWTASDATGMSGVILRDYLRACADADMEGVLSAGAVVVLNHAHGRGMFVELGMAIANGAFIVVIGGRDETLGDCLFYHLPFVHHARNLDHARALISAHLERLNAG